MNAVTIIVTLETEEDSIKRIENYVSNAVGCWGGQLHPNDPLFHVEVTQCQRATPKRLERILNKLSTWTNGIGHIGA